MSTETLTDIAVRTDDVWKIYAQEPEDVEAVRGVSIEVREGDFMTMGGPSGSGKTTLARLAARLTQSEFHEISAVHAGVQEIRKIIAQAERIWKTRQRRSILFIDEIHRLPISIEEYLYSAMEDFFIDIMMLSNSMYAISSAIILQSILKYFNWNM